MADFFISYNSADVAIATEVATAFRDAGCSVKFAGWELGLGDGIDAWMWDAIEDSDRCIGIFSPDYLKKDAIYSQVERETYWWQGILGMRAAVIPVIARDCKMPKVLAGKVRYDLRNSSVQALVEEWQKHPLHSRKTVFLNRQRLDRPTRGRGPELEQLHAGLVRQGKATINTVVKGGGGIGKTTLAKTYIHQHHRDYHGVLWCNAETRSSLIDDIYRLYAYISKTISPEVKTETGASELFDLMGQRGENWLYVFDNLTDFDTMRGLIPQGHLIITTRAAAGWDGFSALETRELAFKTESDPAVRLLMEASDRDNDAAGAQALAEELGGLPLALVIAGGLIREKKDLGFGDYLDQVARIIEREQPNGEYPNSVIGAVRLSYEKLSDDAKLVADLFAWWAPEGLEARLITDAPGGAQWGPDPAIPETVQDLAHSQTRVAAAVEALEERSILRRGAVGFELHRMSAAALRVMQGAEKLNGAAAALLAAVYPAKASVSGNWDDCRRLTPHLRGIWASGDVPKIAAMEFLLNQASVFLDKIGDVAGSIEMARASLELKEARLPEEHRDIAVGYANLGVSLRRLGDLEAAEAALRRAVALDQAHRPGSVDLAESHNLLGGVLFDKSRGGDQAALLAALREYQKAAVNFRREVPRLSDARAQVLNNLGTVRDAMRQGAAALRLAEYALVIQRQVLPEGDARLGAGLMNVGAMVLQSGAADRAEGLLEEALALRQAVYLEAPRHREIVNAARWLVSTYLVRAAAGENRGVREMKARRLCEEFGFEFDARVEMAKQYPYTPGG